MSNDTLTEKSQQIFCHAPWSNVEILPTGAILPCCKFQDSGYQDRYNIRTHDLKQYFTGPMLTEIREQFRQGQWPQGCDRCRIEEASHIPSKRQLDAERWSSAYQQYNIDHPQLLTMSLALGNTCNLKCIMCGPDASSTWAREYHDVYDVKIEPLTQYRKSVLKDLISLSHEVMHIDIHGGEPFLAAPNDHITVLDHFINIGRASEVTLHYTTNGTVWPSQDLIQRWQQFQRVDLQISVDGVGTRFEYIRYPASWSALCENAQRYLDLVHDHSNFSLSIAHTVSAFNVLYLDEFFAWCQALGLPKPWTGRLHNPPHLRCTVWPQLARQMIQQQLNTSSRIEMRRWAHHVSCNSDDLEFEKFKDFVIKHDRYRDLDFSVTFPELAQFL